MMTRRKGIMEILEKEEISAQDLANYFKVEMFLILDDLSHIKRSIKPRRLVMKPSQCRSCGFIFKERSRVKKPSKCPRCRSEWIIAPLFSIKVD